MRDEGERCHEEDEDCGAVLGVAVDFARHADQPEQPRRLQQSYQGRGLQGERQDEFLYCRLWIGHTVVYAGTLYGL